MGDLSQFRGQTRKRNGEWIPPGGWSPSAPIGQPAEEWDAASWRLDAVTPGCKALAESSRTWLSELDARTRAFEARAKKLQRRLQAPERVGASPGGNSEAKST